SGRAAARLDIFRQPRANAHTAARVHTARALTYVFGEVTAMKSYGLGLAGGGAKGAYQIGAWKAMRELGVTCDAITGVSIGAINGALIAQGDFDRAVELWNRAEVKDGIHIETELKEPDNLFSFSNLPQIFREMVKNGGVDVTPARNLI